MKAVKKIICLLLFGCLALSSLSLRAKEKELTVFAGGKPNVYFDIHFDKLPDGGHPLNTAATADFKHYFKEITGQELPVSPAPGLVPIRARIATDKNLGEQNCLIDVSPDEIMLTASDTLGVVNGLYTILDQWGCRWILPGKLGEVIPRRDTLTLPIGGESVTIAMDSRVDSSWMQGDDHPEWRRRNRRSAKQWLTAQHYWLYAIPPKEYYKDHPEYYALIGGKRVPTQLCTSNPEVRELMVQKALEYFKSHPNIASFPMDPADNFDHCQCDNCRKLDDPNQKAEGYPCVTNRVAAFANYVAERIADKYPAKKVGFYAYANKKTPPTIKLHPNVFVPYTRDSSSLIHLTPDPEVPSSAEYWELLKKWQQACPNMYIYEYDPVSWTGSLPCPIYLERARALKKQYAMGIKGAINDMGPRADATLFPNRYMEARFKANPNLDPEQELADMCNKFFGPAGKAMDNYYLTLAKVTECKNDVRFGIEGYDRLFTPAMLKDSRNYLNQALAIGEKSGDDMIRKRLQMVNLAQNYLESYMRFIWNLEKRDYKQSQQDADMIFKAIDALGKADADYLETVDAKRRLTTAVKKNMAKVYPDQMGFIRDWEVVGPFDNNKRDGIVVAGELVARDGKMYIVDQAVPAKNYKSVEGFIDFSKAFQQEPNPDQVYYGYAVTTVNSAISQPVQLRTDSFYPFKIWLNNQLVYVREGLDADCPDKRLVNTRLQAGSNRIVVMVAQSSTSPFIRWGFWLRITDLKGNLIDPASTSGPSAEEQKAVAEALQTVKNGKLANLIPHPAFEGLSSLAASTFGVWPPVIKPNVTLDKTRANSGETSVKFTHITSGSLNRFFSVKPGEKYLVGFDCLNNGKGACFLNVSWRGKGKFLNDSLNRSFFPQPGGEWEQIAGIVTVPADADQLTFCVSVSGQGPDDSCFVDNLMLYKLP